MQKNLHIFCHFIQSFILKNIFFYLISFIFIHCLKLLNMSDMFQPHSVRGLLSRRNKTRFNNQQNNQAPSSVGDQDVQAVVQAKLIIKDIQHKVEDIRKWRAHQKTLLQQQIAGNKQVEGVRVQQYLKFLQRQQLRDNQQKQKLLSKLQCPLDAPLQNINSPWTNSDTNLLQFITNSNKMVEERRYEVEKEEVIADNHHALISDLENMNDFFGGRKEDKGERKEIDRDMLKKELEEIDQELREIQELLK